MSSATWNRERCEALDASDPISRVRERFVLPAGEIYLDGNSLGALPRDVPARLSEVIGDEWGTELIRGWGSAEWRSAPQRVGDKIAPIIGAAPGEVLACDSTTIVLAKLLGAGLGLRPDRRVVLTTSSNFPKAGRTNPNGSSPASCIRSIPTPASAATAVSADSPTGVKAAPAGRRIIPAPTGISPPLSAASPAFTCAPSSSL